MNYQKTIEFLFNSLPMYQRIGSAAYKANLDNTHALGLALGHPHKKFKSVHIAGTNGKGSVSHILASVLQESGYKTGLYTSPHLLNFRERIRVNGNMITEERVIEFIAKIKSEITRISPSFFEMTVAMAFDHFAMENVDIAIIETGLGGRLDSTNIIQPEVSVITNISSDHTEFLGNTKKLIAREKGGIIKKGIPVVSGDESQDVIEVLSEIASEKQTSISWANRIREFKYQTISLDQKSLFHFYNLSTKSEEVIKSDLGGTYQSRNISLCLATIDQLRQASWHISPENIASGIANVKKNTSLFGRWEILGANPRVICDTAHNEAGIEAVMEQIMLLPSRNLHIVWGMVGDKSLENILPHLPKNAIYYFTQPSIPRAMPVENLVKFTLKAGLSGRSFNTVRLAYEAAIDQADKDDTIFIGGSTFIVADLLKSLSE